MSNVANLDDYRPHETAYVVCMTCAHDWIAVFPTGSQPLECGKCGAMAGEAVCPRDIEWFKRFTSAGTRRDAHKRTMVLINAANAWVDK
jgi:hypothetical protein